MTGEPGAGSVSPAGHLPVGPAGVLPVDDDRDTGGFFEAARRHELVVRRCNRCGSLLHLPRAYCHTCGSFEGRWDPVAGTGTVYSWTVVEHQVHPAYPVPYTVILVELDDVPAARYVGRLPGAPDLVAGQRVQVWFDVRDDGTAIPQWKTA
ncbi:MAG: Zn-ribbon domain-containing OB-fold protein [Frankia sp.]